MLEIILLYKDRIPQKNLSILLLIAQLHDFGKNNEICQRYEMDEKQKHEDISAEFVESFFSKKKFASEVGKEIIEIVHNSVMNHHNLAVENHWVKEFREADYSARNKELKLIKNTKRGY